MHFICILKQMGAAVTALLVFRGEVTKEPQDKISLLWEFKFLEEK